MKQNKEDLYIKILTYGKNNIGQPIKFSELVDSLNKEGYEYDDFSLKHFFTHLFIDKNSPHGNTLGMPSVSGEFFLESEGYFHLLEYEELQSARKSSLNATYLASIAIFISIISTIISIYYSNEQLGKPIKIDDASQMEKLNSPITIESSQLEKIDNTSIIKVLNKLEEDNQAIINNIENLNNYMKEKRKYN